MRVSLRPRSQSREGNGVSVAGVKSWSNLILAVILLSVVVGGLRLWRRTDGGGTAAQSQQLLVTDLDSVPMGNRRVLVDESSHHPGELNADDPLWNDSVYVEAWEILGRRDSTVTVNLTSADFEASFLSSGSWVRFAPRGGRVAVRGTAGSAIL